MKFSKSQKGQAMVEFAASVVILTIIGFGAVDMSKAISTYQRMNSVGREAGRIFLKNAFDTVNLSDAALKSRVETKVYNTLKQAMLPDDLGENGTVIISVARRIIRPGETESSDDKDRIEITHQFIFSGPSAGTNPSRISPSSMDTVTGHLIIAGDPVSDPDDPATQVNEDNGFVPLTTIRVDEELIIVEMFYKYDFMTPIDKLIPGFHLDVLYDRTVF